MRNGLRRTVAHSERAHVIPQARFMRQSLRPLVSLLLVFPAAQDVEARGANGQEGEGPGNQRNLGPIV